MNGAAGALTGACAWMMTQVVHAADGEQNSSTFGFKSGVVCAAAAILGLNKLGLIKVEFWFQEKKVQKGPAGGSTTSAKTTTVAAAQGVVSKDPAEEARATLKQLGMQDDGNARTEWEQSLCDNYIAPQVSGSTDDVNIGLVLAAETAIEKAVAALATLSITVEGPLQRCNDVMMAQRDTGDETAAERLMALKRDYEKRNAVEQERGASESEEKSEESDDSGKVRKKGRNSRHRKSRHKKSHRRDDASSSSSFSSGSSGSSSSDSSDEVPDRKGKGGGKGASTSDRSRRRLRSNTVVADFTGGKDGSGKTKKRSTKQKQGAGGQAAAAAVETVAAVSASKTELELAQERYDEFNANPIAEKARELFGPIIQERTTEGSKERLAAEKAIAEYVAMMETEESSRGDAWGTAIQELAKCGLAVPSDKAWAEWFTPMEAEQQPGASSQSATATGPKSVKPSDVRKKKTKVDKRVQEIEAARELLNLANSKGTVTEINEVFSPVIRKRMPMKTPERQAAREAQRGYVTWRIARPEDRTSAQEQKVMQQLAASGLGVAKGYEGHFKPLPVVMETATSSSKKLPKVPPRGNKKGSKRAAAKSSGTVK